jgi:Zn-dependent peptidase ImmA (M78 family)
MNTELMPITPAIVTWARERAGFSIEAVETDFHNIAGWEAGNARPSYPQLERMADKFKVPIAVFFFPAPPDLPPIEETFRTLGPAQFAEIPPRIRLLLRKARTFQMGLDELNGGRNPAVRLITRDLAFRPDDPLEHIATEVRRYLGVTIEQQLAWADVETALQEWRMAFLRVGVYVFKDQFREPNYSGFCLYDPEFPIIYVNNTTAKTRQIFTLFHELAHLLFHTSGVDTTIDDFIGVLPQDARRIEVVCNRIAACLLVPDATFDAAFAGQAPSEVTATELARLFSVSREFIFRKFLDRGLITDAQYEQAARHWAEQIRPSAGGDHYNTKIAYLGSDYINLAFQRFYQNQIDYNQLADYLDTKPRNLARLEEYISRKNS